MGGILVDRIREEDAFEKRRRDFLLEKKETIPLKKEEEEFLNKKPFLEKLAESRKLILNYSWHYKENFHYETAYVELIFSDEKIREYCGSNINSERAYLTIKSYAEDLRKYLRSLKWMKREIEGYYMKGSKDEKHLGYFR